MSLFEFEDRTPEQRAAAVEALHAANIARSVLHRRLEEGWSQGQLAALAKTTQARVSEIESLKGDPRLSTLGRVAYALGCMIDMVPIPAATTTTLAGYTTMRSVDQSMTASGGRATAWWVDSQRVVSHVVRQTYG